MSRMSDRIDRAEGRGCFVRCTGVNDSYSEDIIQLDKRFAHRGDYIRIDRFELPKDPAETEKLRSEAEEFAKSREVSEVMSLYRSSTGRINPTIENNLLVSLLYRRRHLLRTDGGILVCCGRIGYKEYLFCYLASLYGWSTLMLMPEGDGALPPVLTAKSELLELGEPRSISIPPYDKAAVLSAEKSAESSDDRREVSSKRGGIKVAIPPRERRKSSAPPAENSVTAHAAPAAAAHPERSAVKVAVPPKERRSTAAASAVNTATDVRQPRHGSTPTVKRELSYEELAMLAESVVMISLCDGSGNVVGNGSGVAIGEKGYILTNCHVVDHGALFSVRFENDERPYPAVVIKYHSVYDVALLRVERRVKPLPLYTDKADLVRGQRVVAIGSPMGLINTVSDGIISGFRIVNEMKVIQFTAPISHGSSGGALINMYGELIGVCFGGVDKGQNLNLAVSCREIAPFISGFI